MGFLDGLLKQTMGGQGGAGGLGDLVSVVSKNPQILTALAGLLSTRDASVGGSGGLAGLVGDFQKKGLGDMISGWISTGPNSPVSAAQVTDLLGQKTLAQFGAKAGVPVSEAVRGGLGRYWQRRNAHCAHADQDISRLRRD